jgi:hypothetical protein
MIAEPDATLLATATAELRTGTLTVARLSELRELAEHHGFLTWLADAALATDVAADDALRSVLTGHLRDAIVRDLLQQAATRRVVDALAGASIRTIVLKGEHVARAFYPKPYLRPRSDADLFIAPTDRSSARAVVERLGYVLLPHVRGDAIMAEMQFTRTDVTGFAHAIDVHWHAVTPHPFRSILPFDEAWLRSTSIAALGPAALGLSAPDALLLAIVHLAVHHPCDARLMWIADVDLIARTLTPTGWAAFEAATERAGVCAIARQALLSAARFFSTPLPEGFGGRLASRAAGEALAREYLVPRSRAARLASELRSLPRWQDRAAVVYQHVVPDAEYMRQRYGANGLALGWAYMWRAARGARAWLTRPVSSWRPAGRADRAPRVPRGD